MTSLRGAVPLSMGRTTTFVTARPKQFVIARPRHSVIARPKAVAIHAGIPKDMDCRAALAVTAPGVMDCRAALHAMTSRKHALTDTKTTPRLITDTNV